MKLFDRLNNRIDYNNHYTIKKAVGIMESEFNKALRNKDVAAGREILDSAKRIYENLSSSYTESQDYGETMSHLQKIWAKRLRGFIDSLTRQLRNNFGE